MASEEGKKKIFEYAQQNPKLYPLMQAEVFPKMLEAITIEAKSAEDLELGFGIIERQDIIDILETLWKLQLASRILVAGKTLYYATEKGKEFIKYCKIAKESLSVA